MLKNSESPTPTEKGQTMPLNATQSELLKSVKLQCLKSNEFFERLQSMIQKNVEPFYKDSGEEEVKDYDKAIDNCFISKQTWNFIECVLTLKELWGKVNDSLTAMYGEKNAEDLLLDDEFKFTKNYRKLESALYELVTDSINEFVGCNNFNKI